jgi:SAM-dependent methyltransferase
MFKYINCESFDDSHLYKDIYIEQCNKCGHLYNKLSNVEIKNLSKYYKYEYAPSNLSLEDKVVDRPGSDNPSSIKRYEQIFNSIVGYLNDSNARILDVGCATGGFLRYCETKGYFNTNGIDPIMDYVDKADNENVKFGSVYSIPFRDNSFDVVVLEQVLEHLSNPKLAMKEIKRVLRKGGLCYIGVPDAKRYNDELYFYLIREHIQHFNLNSLNLLAEYTGFELINHNETESDMIGSLKLPNLSVILKLTRTIYCWGIGREFMYRYVNSRLKDLDKEYLILVDDTPHKQKQTFKGMKIHSSDILKEADKDSFLIITANVHKELLKKKALEIGYKGVIINV